MDIMHFHQGEKTSAHHIDLVLPVVAVRRVTLYHMVVIV